MVVATVVRQHAGGIGYMTVGVCLENGVNIVPRQCRCLTILFLSQMIAVATWPMSGTTLCQ